VVLFAGLAYAGMLDFSDEFDAFDAERSSERDHQLGRSYLDPVNVGVGAGNRRIKLPACSLEGGEIRSNALYGYGTYSARMKLPNAPSSITGFFLFEPPDYASEIDVEIYYDSSRRMAFYSTYAGGAQTHTEDRKEAGCGACVGGAGIVGADRLRAVVVGWAVGGRDRGGGERRRVFAGFGVGAMHLDVVVPGQGPVTLSAVVSISFVPALMGALLFAVMGRFTRRPIRTFRVVAAVVLVLSFASPFTLPSAPVAMIRALLLMHVIAAVAITGVLTTLGRRG
jgi:hypothetical protein